MTLSRESLSARLAGLMTGEPNDKIVAILGGEGNGKSWLAAQGWLSLDEKPVLLFFPADDVAQTNSGDAEDTLIRKLMKQAGGNVSEEAEKGGAGSYGNGAASPLCRFV